MSESIMDGKVVEAFGKYVAKIDGEITFFNDKLAAVTAVAMYENKEDMAARATAYCKAKGLIGKNEKTKTRIITDFLAFEATLEVPFNPQVEQITI